MHVVLLNTLTSYCVTEQPEHTEQGAKEVAQPLQQIQVYYPERKPKRTIKVPHSPEMDLETIWHCGPDRVWYHSVAMHYQCVLVHTLLLPLVLYVKYSMVANTLVQNLHCQTGMC